MDLNQYLSVLEILEKDGAVVILKWDGERSRNKKTIVVSKPGTDYHFRADTDELESAIESAVLDYHNSFNVVAG